MLIPDDYWRSIVDKFLANELASTSLRGVRVGNDGGTYRIQLQDGRTLILKVWNRHGAGGLYRRITRSGPAHREWNSLLKARELGIETPAPLGILTNFLGKYPFSDAIFLEDLGPCVSGFDFLKLAISDGRLNDEEKFVQHLIDTTVLMVRGDLIDTDHRLANYIVLKDSRIVRLDFECASVAKTSRKRSRDFARMLGTLIVSYCIAVQPDTNRVERFVNELIGSLSLERDVLRQLGSLISMALTAQRSKRGIPIVWLPDW